jgi:phosphatidylinositol-3-phosphatase
MRPSWHRPARSLVAIALALAATAVAAVTAGASRGPAVAPATTDAVPKLGHVFVIVGENTSANQITAAHAPYLTKRLRPRSAWLTNYHSLRHRTSSLGDYIGMTSGQFTRCEANDALPFRCHQGINNLFSQLDHAGLSWRVWAQSMANPCDIVDHGTDWSRNVYSAHHNPAIYYTRIEGGHYDEAIKPSAECVHRDVSMGSTAPNDASVLNRSLRAGHGVADFNMLIPNDCTNGHDPCGGNRISQFDAFLRREVPRIERSPAFGQSGLIIITWDEGADPPLDPHHVLTVALGSQVNPGTYSGRPLTHYGLLRTLEDGFGLPRLGAARRALPITAIWR